MKQKLYQIIVTTSIALAILSCSKDANNSQQGKGGSLARYAVAGNYLYIVDHQSLDVYDVSSPDHMEFKSSQIIGFDIETIYPYKGKLFIGSSVGLYVYSITDPEKPSQEGSITHMRSCDPVVATDSVAYVTLRSGMTCGGNNNLLNVYLVKNVMNPQLIRTIDMISPYGLGIKEKALYVCEGGNGMVVFDLTKPLDPKRIKEIKNETYLDVIPYGNVLICYVSGGVMFYDISNPFQPQLRGSVLK